MTEAMMTMLIVCVLLMTVVLPGNGRRFKTVMERLEEIVVQEQLAAFAGKEQREVEIGVRSIETASTSYRYPDDIACTPFSFHYTADGTISAGGTVKCWNEYGMAELVFRIGASRVEIR